MNKYLQEYRPFLVFIGSFFLVYITLTFFYQLYLNSFPINAVDGITQMVGNQVEWFLTFFSPDVVTHNISGAVYLTYNSMTSVRIIEGCNAVSVFILFVAFVTAFAGTFKNMLIFCGLGTAFLYVLNVFRIVFLIVLLNKFPAYNRFLHDILFPLIIYGSMFVLWFVWITKYSKYADI